MPPVLTQWQRRACPFPRKKRSRGKRQKTHEILGVAPLHCNPGMLNFRTEMAIEHDRVSFGVFEVDRQARELRKHGVRIKLEDQPFEILTALLEKPGDIVTRSELQARLWPEGTFVDFDKASPKQSTRSGRPSAIRRRPRASSERCLAGAIGSSHRWKSSRPSCPAWDRTEPRLPGLGAPDGRRHRPGGSSRRSLAPWWPSWPFCSPSTWAACATACGRPSN